jgi:chaperonin GroES
VLNSGFPFQINHRYVIMALSITPLSDRVVVKPKEAEEKTASGIIIPDTAKEKPQQGTVVAVGPGRFENGTKIDMSVKEGDTVLYGKYFGTELTLEGEDVLIMRESDILGVVK